MLYYSQKSKDNRAQAHPDLQVLFDKVLELGYDHLIA